MGKPKHRRRKKCGVYNHTSRGGPPQAAWWVVSTLRPSESQNPKTKTDTPEMPQNPPTYTLMFREEALAL